MKFRTTPLRVGALLSMLFMLAGSLAAQDAYYWSGGQPIGLTVDRTAFAAHYEAGQLPTGLENVTDLPGVASVDLHPYHHRLVVMLDDAASTSALQKLQDLGISTDGLRSTHFAYRTENDFQLWLTHDVVLKAEAGTSLGSLQSYLEQHNAVYSRDRFGTTVLEVADPADALALANDIRENENVEFALPDFYAPISRDIDPLYDDQFQMNNTGQVIDGWTSLFDVDANAPEAWAVTTGSSSIVVAVMDDGVEAHEDLENDATGASRVISGFSPVGSSAGAPTSGAAHGQACAGIVAASHNEIGVRGVAPGVTIMPINIFVGGETSQDIADCFSYAQLNGADVISNSWGYVSSCGLNLSNLTSAINSADANGRGGLGCVIAFAAGNGYQSCVDYPAYLSSVVAVGSVTNQGNHSNYSNEGSELDLVAPSNPAPGQAGAGVRTLDRMGSAGYSFGNTTNSFGGTSAACPVVAGAAALVLSADPLASSTDVKNTLITTATDMGSAGFDNTFGWGRINAGAAVSGGVAPTISYNGTITDADSGIPVSDASVTFIGPGGSFETSTDASGNYSISDLIDEALYVIYVGKWGYQEEVDATVVFDGGSRTTAINAGYSDNFNTDQGWIVSGTATTGLWERGDPIGTDYSGSISNPENDASDAGDLCYVTGNGGGSAGTDDVDNGTAILSSPSFDLSTYTDPWIRYSRWFFNDGGSTTPDDQLIISLSNGSTTVVLETVDASAPDLSTWALQDRRVSDFLTPTANMTLIVETSDLTGTGHLVEAGLDAFVVSDSATVGPSPCTVAPTGLSAAIGATGVTVSWNSLASNGALLYQVSGRRLGLGSYRSLPAISEPATSAFVSENKLNTGTTYEWKVVAACDLAGTILSPESTPSTFTWTTLREGQLTGASGLFPNPASDRSYLSYQMEQKGELTATITDLSGKQHALYQFNLAPGQLTLDFDLSDLSTGMYLLNLTTADASETLQLEVIR